MRKKVLIIAPPWVGDMVMTQALLRLLKKHDPDCSIDVFAIPALHPLIGRMPEVDRCIASPFKAGELKLWERFKLGRDLRHHGYTYAYLIPNSFKSALVPFFAGIPVRVGWRGEGRDGVLNDVRVLDKKNPLSMVERFVSLGYPKGKPLEKPLLLPQLTISQDQLAVTLSRLKISLSKRPILALCPGSGSKKTKRWPPKYFAEVAIAKKRAGWEVWIFGGKPEQALARIIQEKCYNACLDLTGKIDLDEAVDLLSLAKVVVANDSGLMHLAAAIHKPLVVIYGPTLPELAPPLTTSKFKMLSLRLPCSPCSKAECNLKYHKCMDEIKPELVIRSILDVCPQLR